MTNTTEDKLPYYGDAPGLVPPEHFRCGCINVDNLPFTKDDSHHNNKTTSKDSKNERLFNGMKNYGLDIMLTQENGLNWAKVDNDAGFRQRAELYLDKHDMKAIACHNKNDTTGNTLQAGGTGIVTHGKLSHFGMGAGGDSTGLGRWTWTRYRGRNNMVFRCVSIYQPVKPSRKSGTKTVWAQHKAYLQAHKDDRNPRQAFMQDLDKSLAKWINEGDQIFLGGDINTCVQHRKVRALFTKHNMRNVLSERHGTANAPTTYYMTRGNRVVDGLWATPGIQISAGGYLEPGDFPGNHSLLWADISFVSALGHDPPLPMTPQARRLKLSDSRTTKKYLDNYEKSITGQRLLARQFKLESGTHLGRKLTPRQSQEAEAIDFLKQTAMLRAEKKCRKLKMGGVSFSEATFGPLRCIDFWECAIRRRKRKKVSSRMWKRKKKKAKIEADTRQMSLADLEAALLQSTTDYRNAKRNHREERTKFLDTLAPKDRDRLKRVEAQRELAYTCKRVTGKLSSKSVTKLEINGHECTSKREIEETLLGVNEDKIHSSEDTAFMMEPLLSAFSYDLNSPSNEAVLDGTFVPPPGTPPAARTLLRGLRRPIIPNRDSFKPRRFITTADHVKAWRRAKETTSSGMSRLHFGMYKAHIRRQTLASFDASQRSVAYSTGYVYNRWRRGLDVQLLKRKKDYRADKLRTILLLEADFNMNNKCLGSDAMRYGERNNIFTKHNYGGRKNLRAPEVSMNSTLTNDSIRGRRGRAVIVSNDARGCYDRIAHIVVALALQRLGIHKSCLQSMISAIQTMDHYIRTAFGDSEGSYGNDSSRPAPQGILQGNGAAPAGWFAISTVLIDALRDAGFGYQQWSMIRHQAINITCFAFVDDTDLIHSIHDPSVSTATLVAEAQAVLTLWQELIRATGGDLHPDKSYWYLLEMERANKKWQYKKIAANPGDIYLAGNPREIDRYEPTKAKEALGIQTRPDGAMTDQLDYMTAKVTEWCDAIRTKRITREEAWYCLNRTIMKTLEYPLMATSLTREQIQKLMSPLLRTALPKCGLQSRLPRKLLYGTYKTRGTNIRDLYWTQLIQKLQAIMRHQSRRTPSKDLHIENMEILQVHIGSDQPFWSLPFEQYGCLAPDSWMKHAWQSLDESPLSFTGPLTSKPLARRRDQHIMDVFASQGHTEQDLITLNDCRLHLQVTSLADMCTADGTTITMDAWTGKQQLHRYVHWKHWPKTYKPSANSWIFWQSTLRQSFLSPHTDTRRLRQTLGPWKMKRDDEWLWWIHTSGDLYERSKDSSWTCWHPVPGRATRNATQRFSNPTPVDAPPHHQPLRRVIAIRRTNLIVALTSGIGYVIPSPAVPNQTLPSLLAELPLSAHWALQRMQCRDDGEILAAAISNGTAVAVSDGSLKDSRGAPLGTAAYIIQSESSAGQIDGVNKVPGPIKDGDSHRCELAGLYAIILIINTICKHYSIISGSVIIACDNMQAINLFDIEFVPDPNGPNFDLVSAIWNLKEQSPIQWLHQHVKGHQDTKSGVKRKLTRLETLNVAMDLLAKQYWAHIASNPHHPPPQHIPIYGEGWQVWSGNNKVAHPSTHTLYSEIHDPITQMWWVRNNFIRADAMAIIDWNATEQMMKSLPEHDRRHITKHASHNCGVGTTLVAWNKQDDSDCPRCNQPETTEHVLRCRGYDATTVWNKSIANLTSLMISSKTEPGIQEAILYGLKQWRTSQPIALAGFPPDLHSAIRQQSTIGWKSFFEGLPAKHWQRRQLQHIKQNRLRTSSRKWITRILTHIHYIARDLWRHRNYVKHTLDKPRHKRALALLKQLISDEHIIGTDQLLEGDHNLFHLNLIDLLQKTEPYLKSWYTNLRTARQRYIQITEHADAQLDATLADSAVRQWMQGVPR